MSQRVKRTGVRLQMWAMERITRELEALPLEDRQVVMNWISAQDWSVPTKEPLDSRQSSIPELS